MYPYETALHNLGMELHAFLIEIRAVYFILVKSVLYKMVLVHLYMSLVVRKPTFWFPTWSDTSQAVQLKKMARGLKF